MSAIFTPSLYKDGQWGSVSVKAMQRFLQYYGYYPKGYAIDGIVGYYTARGMQRWLNNRGYYPSNAIDGDDGPRTWAAIASLVDAYFTHVSGVKPPYSNWTPYNHPNEESSIVALLQFWLNEHRFPITSA